MDTSAIWLTLKLATVTTAALLIVSTPIAWWLARTRSVWRAPIATVLSLPLVLPPTVLGFYLLIFLGPTGHIGRLAELLGLGPLTFSFTGLVLASVVYSLPFCVQPLQNAFEAAGAGPLEAAATLGAGPWDRFVSIALPLARPGFFTAAVIGFAHTVGEFGIVLMIGGNIPGETRVLSIAIFDHVEALEYAEAHWLAGGLLIFSFVALITVNLYRRSFLGGTLR